jgi:hypothetical protein
MKSSFQTEDSLAVKSTLLPVMAGSAFCKKSMIDGDKGRNPKIFFFTGKHRPVGGELHFVERIN